MSEVPPAPGQAAWQRLDPRKLVVDPVKLLGQALVPAVAVIIGVSSSGNSGFLLLATPFVVVGAVLLGAVPWLTTYYRVGDGQFQLRRGLLNKSTSTAPLDRVRSVDLEASLLHRLLGLRKVQIGTGVDDERIELDAVSAARAADLRGLLLSRAASTEPTVVEPSIPTLPAASTEQELARIDWTWLRFAPFSLSRLVIVAGAVGFLSQFADDFGLFDQEHVGAAWRWLTGFAVAVVAVALLLTALVGWLVVSVGGYVLQWWGLRLTREHGSLHLSSGLLTTRAISVEERRVRGVELQEPVLLRLVGGAELSTLATGVGEGGLTSILPPCPSEVAAAVGGDVLEDPTPLAVPLRRHGPAARRRAWIRQQWLTLFLLVVAVVLAVVDLPEEVSDRLPSWLPVALVVASAAFGALVARSSYAHLGHALTDRHLVAGSGDLTRVRTVLETDGIIGWVVKQTPFQRRVGLATLTATTAAGNERVVVHDVPHGQALALADAATPGMLAPFRAAPAGN